MFLDKWLMSVQVETYKEGDMREGHNEFFDERYALFTNPIGNSECRYKNQRRHRYEPRRVDNN